MSQPRWYREQCPHDVRVQVTDWLGRVIHSYCQDCRAPFPTDA